MNADNVFQLPKGCSWTSSGMLQYAPNKLLPSQQMILGGFSTVRGYKENAIAGNRGVLLRNELRSCPVNFMTFKNFPSKAQLLYFVDCGSVRGANAQSYDTTHATLLSTGAGFRYSLMENVDMKMDFGYALKKLDNKDRKYCWHASITASY
jgi:hemolysin activation/secretion protein